MSRLLIFDSGIGGLSVAGDIRRAMPAAELIYLADDAGFPYGDWQGPALSEHVVGLIGELIGRFAPEGVVIACNTASTLVLPHLRARHEIPFVGTVPAIKPAAERTQTGRISVLATPGTMERDYTRQLIRNFAQGRDVRLVGSYNLAPLAEAHMRGGDVDDAAIYEEIAPAFVDEGGRRTDIVVLACTHYPFLMPHFRRLAPWPVEWIDPAPAIARRVVSVLGPESRDAGGGGKALLTSGKAWPAPLHPFLEQLKLYPFG